VCRKAQQKQKLNKNNGQVGRETLQLFTLSLASQSQSGDRLFLFGCKRRGTVLSIQNGDGE